MNGPALFGGVFIKHTVFKFHVGLPTRSQGPADQGLVIGELAIGESGEGPYAAHRTSSVSGGVVPKNTVVEFGILAGVTGDRAAGPCIRAGDGDALKTQGDFGLSAVFSVGDAPVPLILTALKIDDAVGRISTL